MFEFTFSFSVKKGGPVTPDLNFLVEALLVHCSWYTAVSVTGSTVGSSATQFFYTSTTHSKTRCGNFLRNIYSISSRFRFSFFRDESQPTCQHCNDGANSSSTDGTPSLAPISEQVTIYLRFGTRRYYCTRYSRGPLLVRHPLVPGSTLVR